MIKKYSEILNKNRYIIFYSVTERIFFFLAFLIIARKFPVEVYGQIVTLFSLANIIIILFDFGLPVFLQKEVASLKEKSSVLVSNVLMLFVISFPVYLILGIIYSRLFFPEISLLLTSIIFLSVYFFSAGNLFNKVLAGLNDFRSQFKVNLRSRLPALILLICLAIFFKTGLTAFLIVLLCSALLQIIITLNIVKKHGLLITADQFSLSRSFTLIKISLPLGLAVIFNFLYDKIDILLISKLTDFDQTAFYNVAYGIYKSSAILFSFLFVSGLTEVSSYERDKNSVKSFFKKYSVILIEICFVLTIILFFLSDRIVTLVYTEKFSDSGLILKILSFALIGLALNNLTGIILNGMGFFKENMKVTLTGLITNVVLNIAFIPIFGIVASAVITIITEYLIFAGGYFYLRKFLKSD